MTITLSIPYEERFIQVNGVHLHTILAGPESGEPVILLHGFPEFWYGWRHQIPALVERGYRVIVPDQRGYNLSDKPDGIESYRINTLAKDIKTLADMLGYDQINLVGHDWGAAVSWWVATIYPNILKKMVILNVPYPSIMLDEAKKLNLRQILKSWYIGFFQIPRLPEAVFRRNQAQPLVDMLLRTSNNGSFSTTDIAQYRQAWLQPKALRSMINWYRATGNPGPDPENSLRTKRENGFIKVPTLMLWGENDIALTKELAQPSIDLCENGRLVFFPNATHWVQHDEAEAVNQHLIEFLGS
jgi:pimeloyl-ACP methyl ester carboxylesterase